MGRKKERGRGTVGLSPRMQRSIPLSSRLKGMPKGRRSLSLRKREAIAGLSVSGRVPRKKR